MAKKPKRVRDKGESTNEPTPKLDITVVSARPPVQVIEEGDLARMGSVSDVVAITQDDLRQYSKVCDALNETGALRISNSMVLVANTAVLAAMVKLRENVESDEQRIDSSNALARLGATVAKLNQEFRKTNEVNPSRQLRKQKSFEIGKPVQLTQHNYYYADGNKEPDKPA